MLLDCLFSMGGATVSTCNAMWENMLAGGLGGVFVAIARFVLTYVRLDSTDPKYGLLLAIQIPIFLSLFILGAGLAWVTTGISGGFITGAGALGFMVMIGGQILDRHNSHPQEVTNGTTDNQA